MNKIYIIHDLSHEMDDYAYSIDIESIYDSLEDAKSRMEKLEDFCKSTMGDDGKWSYIYELWEYDLPFHNNYNNNRSIISRTQNF